MAEAGLWVAWGVPARGRERQAVDVFNESMQYLGSLQEAGKIERFDVAILMPQSSELGGFGLIQGTQEQIDSLRRDQDFQRWVNLVQLVADKFGVVDAWVDNGLPEALSRYQDALRRLG